MNTDWSEVARKARENKDAKELAERDAQAGVSIRVDGETIIVCAQSRVCTDGEHAGTWTDVRYEFNVATLTESLAGVESVVRESLRHNVFRVQPASESWVLARVREALNGMTGFVRWSDPTL